MKTEASSFSSDGCPISADSGPFSWDGSLVSAVEVDDTGVNERNKSPGESGSPEDIDSHKSGASLSGSDAHEEAPTNDAVTTSKGKGKGKGKGKQPAALDLTHGITVSSTEATASSGPTPHRSSASPSNDLGSKKARKHKPSSIAWKNGWNGNSENTAVEEPAVGSSSRVPTSANGRFNAVRQEVLKSLKRNHSVKAPQPWIEKGLDAVEAEDDSSAQSEDYPFPGQGPPPPSVHKVYGCPFRPPSGGQKSVRSLYTHQLGQRGQSGQRRFILRPNHHKYQKWPTRIGRPPYNPPHLPANVVPRQCIPYRGARTTSDRWDEVTLPFHISRVDETGQYQQLFVFEVDAFYVYAFLLVDDIAELSDGSELDEIYDDGTWGQGLAEEDAHDTVGIDHDPSLDQDAGSVSPCGVVEVTNGDDGKPDLLDIICARCHGRDWSTDPRVMDGDSDSEDKFNDLCCAKCYGKDWYKALRVVQRRSEPEPEPELYDTCCSKCQGRGWVKGEASAWRKRAPMHRR